MYGHPLHVVVLSSTDVLVGTYTSFMNKLSMEHKPHKSPTMTWSADSETLYSKVVVPFRVMNGRSVVSGGAYTVPSVETGGDGGVGGNGGSGGGGGGLYT